MILVRTGSVARQCVVLKGFMEDKGAEMKIFGWRLVCAVLAGAVLSGPYLEAGQTEGRVLGYINHIPQESAEARARRHRRVAQRRAGIPVMVHRGARSQAPENTLEAYAAAMDLGADGVEIDIRRSRDGILYLFHDDTAERLTHATGKVREMTYYELLAATPMHVYGRATEQSRPPTLAAFLVLVRQRAMLLHLDVKEAGLQDEIAQMFDQADVWDHVVEVNGGNAETLRPPDDPANADPNAPYNKVSLIPYKGWVPEGDYRDPDDIERIRRWLPKMRGTQMVFCRDPRPAINALGRTVPRAVSLPGNLRAWWGPEGIIEPRDP